MAKDVAQALEYAETSNPARLFALVPEIWRGVKRIHTTSDKTTARPYQDVLCLTEQGLYFFLGRSDKPNALPYQMWIAGEVVPSIRKHGAYMTPQTIEDMLADPDGNPFALSPDKQTQRTRGNGRAVELGKKWAEIDPAHTGDTYQGGARLALPKVAPSAHGEYPH